MKTILIFLSVRWRDDMYVKCIHSHVYKVYNTVFTFCLCGNGLYSLVTEVMAAAASSSFSRVSVYSFSGLELTMWDRLSLNSQRSICFCLQSADMKGVLCHTWYPWLLNYEWITVTWKCPDFLPHSEKIRFQFPLQRFPSKLGGKKGCSISFYFSVYFLLFFPPWHDGENHSLEKILCKHEDPSSDCQRQCGRVGGEGSRVTSACL